MTLGLPHYDTMTPLTQKSTLLSVHAEQVDTFARRHQLWKRGETLVLGLSGGQDSTAMLLILAALRDVCGLQLHALHLHHGIRGQEADEDAEYSRILCKAHDIPFHLHYASIPDLKRTLRVGTQEAARIERHRVLREVMRAVGATRIALAHTRDDRVETILFNIMRGSGPTGATGLNPRHGAIIRPLLEFTRPKTLQVCTEQEIAPRTDSSNSDPHYTRNRIRTELLPGIRAYYNSSVDDALIRFADVLQAEDEFVGSIARETFSHCADVREDYVKIPNVNLQAQPLAIQRRLVRLALEQMAGSLVDVPFSSVTNALTAIAERTSFGEDLPARPGAPLLRILVKTDGLYVVPQVSQSIVQKRCEWQTAVAVPGATRLPSGEVIVTVVAPPGKSLLETLREATSDTQNFQFLAVNCLKADGGLLARSGRPGDKISCFGMRGTKSVKEILRQAGVPPNLRSSVPIITTANGRILIAGTYAFSLDCSPLLPTSTGNSQQVIGVVVVPKGL